MEKYFNINKQGCNVRCKIYFSSLKNVKRAVICGHGFGGHKDNKAAERFADYVLKKFKDVVVITYNAPCHGDDVKKVLALDDCGKYIGIVTEYASSNFRDADLCCYATSFGGYQFLKYIAEEGNPFKKIFLRCPAVDMHKVLSDSIMNPAELKALQKGKPIQVGFDRKIKINQRFLDELKSADIREYDYQQYADSIFVIHGTSDEIVPFETAKNFCEKNSIRFVPVDGADHRFRNPDKMDEAIKLIVEFFGF